MAGTELPNSGNTTLSLPPNTANDIAAMRNYMKRLVGELERAFGKQFDNTAAVAAETNPTVDLTTDVSGILPTVNGGTGSEEAANAASGVCILDAGAKVAIANLPVGTGASQLVQMTAAPAKLPAVDGSQLTGITTTGYSNVLFEWHGATQAGSGDNNGIVSATDGDFTDTTTEGKSVYLRMKGNAYIALLSGRFVKVSGVSTVTIHAKLWSNTADAGSDTTLKVDIGTTNGTVTNNDSATPTWVTTSTIDVSGLTNGTVYTITVSLINQNPNSYGFCSDIMLIGS